MSYFKDRIPTSENFAHVLWTKMAAQRNIGTLHTLRLCEDEDLYAEVTATDGPDMAAVAKRYSFNAIQEDHQGRDWDCYVTVHGTIDLMTGMVTDIGVLDRLVQDRIIKPFDRQDLRKVLGSETVRGEALAKTIWDCLAGYLSGGTLHNVRLVQTRDLSFDYAG